MQAGNARMLYATWHSEEVTYCSTCLLGEVNQFNRPRCPVCQTKFEKADIDVIEGSRDFSAHWAIDRVFTGADLSEAAKNDWWETAKYMLAKTPESGTESEGVSRLRKFFKKSEEGSTTPYTDADLISAADAKRWGMVAFMAKQEKTKPINDTGKQLKEIGKNPQAIQLNKDLAAAFNKAPKDFKKIGELLAGAKGLPVYDVKKMNTEYTQHLVSQPFTYDELVSVIKSGDMDADTLSIWLNKQNNKQDQKNLKTILKVRDKDDLTPLMLAARYQSYAVPPLLAAAEKINFLQEVVEAGGRYGNALWVAARFQSAAVPPLLATAEKIVGFRSILKTGGSSALMVAARYQPAAVLPIVYAASQARINKLLLVSASENALAIALRYQPTAALPLLAIAEKEGLLKEVLQWEDFSLFTALMIAAQYSNPDIVARILHLGSDPKNWIDMRRNIAIRLAEQRGGIDGEVIAEMIKASRDSKPKTLEKIQNFLGSKGQDPVPARP